ncbi:site-specific DNA-methyltransferase [Sphingomonas sp.]|jgi:DNA modification methylase|uniref:DNA-methyltransferase n=1 Tax=Sphingomonas sp. TaxID=28214 RepID=UPI003569C171
MAVIAQRITEQAAIYNSDCMEVMSALPDGKVHMSIYSPPFGGLYNYSSSERDLSNCDGYDGFFEHYEYIVREIHRVTIPGRLSYVHCMDVPLSNSGADDLEDFPGDIIRLHKRLGFSYIKRHCIWKEPLSVRIRTMQKNLQHNNLCEDSTKSGVASADYLLVFRKKGENPVPVAHPTGMMEYAGERQMPAELFAYRGWTGKQTENKFSHWIWRQYASCFWDDIRMNVVLPYEGGSDPDDEKHVHPLQLDVIERAVILGSNRGETILTPFMGVGSEVYGAVVNGRRGIGIELKESYYRQAVKNIEMAEKGIKPDVRNMELDLTIAEDMA